MRETPPHILLTNYAMLEYLLLRPDDTAFFDGDTGRHWRFIVLDEMHVYNGAKGAEIAMLLRRVRDRVNNSTPGRVQYIGTSATLGTGKPIKEVAAYATALFDETVQHHDTDPNLRDVVTPEFADSPAPHPTWKADPSTFPAILQTLTTGAAAPGLPTTLPPHTTTDAQGLLEALDAEHHVIALRAHLSTTPLDISEASGTAFSGISQEQLRALLDICTSSHNKTEPLVPARYHYILRAIEGAFVCLSQKHPPNTPKLQLDRHKECPLCAASGTTSTMFEFGVCGRCGASYIIGRKEEPATGDGVVIVHAPPQHRGLTYLLLDEQATEDDEDEAAVVDDEQAKTNTWPGWLCTACGGLFEDGTARCACSALRQVTVAEPSKAKPRKTVAGAASLNEIGKPLRRCPACTGRTNSDIVLRFFTGQDAPVAVIATALYQSIPGDPHTATIGEGRKLLSFSDNRQDAAFFAPYLQRTYSRAVQRRLLWQVLHHSQQHHDGPLRFEDLVPRMRRLAEEHLVLDPDSSSATKNTTVRRWLMAEVLATDRRQSLDSVGLAEITVDTPQGVAAPVALTKLGFTQTEALDIAAVMLETLRSNAAVNLPEDVDIADQSFAPRNIVTAVRVTDPANGVIAWMPARGKNRRLDYLIKLFARRDIQADPIDVLDRIWHWLTHSDSPWSKALQRTKVPKHGFAFRINPAWITMIPETPDHQPYECSNCRQVAWRNVSDVCPAYSCDGTLQPAPPAGRPAAAHFRHLYTRLNPSAMRAEEHTAQLETDEAAARQQEFLDGTVNTLSCTTTFELGVDVGDVHTVLMRNVPPSPANYVQRAGRAGRRGSSTPLVVTFAQRRSHDLHHFKDPMRLIRGHVDVPILSLQNPLIARRHIHAVAFAAYERKHVSAGGSAHKYVSSFFRAAPGQSTAPVHDFIAWLRSHPKDLGDAIQRITPAELAHTLGTKTWDWVTALTNENSDDTGENHGWLTRAINEITDDIDDIDAQMDAATAAISDHRANNRDKDVDSQLILQKQLNRVKRTLQERQLISHLATRVVLPKYGFPVDVVALDVWRAGDAGAEKLDLSRDLRVAITDYAPGSKVVANKALWECTGLRVHAGKSLLNYIWAECECGSFRTKHIPDNQDREPGPCQSCGSTETTSKYTFVVPLFGFVGRRSKEQPGDTRPPKLGWAQSHFSDYADGQPTPEQISVGSGVLEASFSRQGRITAINEGPAQKGFMICMSCGHGQPAVATGGKTETHVRPNTQRECNGFLSHRHLGHQYLTDVLELSLPFPTTPPEARSALYALLAAMPDVGIPVGDVDGTLRQGPNRSSSLIVFDTVPGGAGHVRRVCDRLPVLITGALRAATCDCEERASCYGCLRTYHNQRFHEELARGDALTVLNALT